MMLRRTSRFSKAIAGLPLLSALILLAPSTSRAEDLKPTVTWQTGRTTEPEDLEELKALQDRVQKLVEKCTPCTVGILIEVGGMTGAGSGVIVSDDGLVLTAAHVITGEVGTYESGKECRIVLPDGKRVKAKTLGVNTKIDSGMVQITDKAPTKDGKWPFLPIGKSAELKKDQWLVSLGHPGGPKTGRPPAARLGRIESVTKELIRSNCTLVGGDSGGPLFDLDGNVVGIHSRIMLTLSQNIHIPTDQFKNQWDQLVKGEVFGIAAKKKPAPAVGVTFNDDDSDDAWIKEVIEEGPAEKAGLKIGDTITKIDGQTVKSIARYREIIQTKKPGDVVKLTIRRGTEILNLEVTLGKK